MLTIYGVVVLTFMMLMYALERRDRRFVLAFALGCALSSSYGFLSGAWPFGVVEAVWCVIAIHRYLRPVPEPRTVVERPDVLWAPLRSYEIDWPASWRNWLSGRTWSAGGAEIDTGVPKSL